MLAGELWASGQDVTKDYSEPGMKKVKRVLMNAYWRICRMTDWASLRRRTSYTFTTAHTTGQYLPSNSIAVMGVVCETDGSEAIYYPTQQAQRYKLDGKRHWYHPDLVTEPLDDLRNGITIEESGVVFSGTLGGDRTGEWIRFADELGYYEIQDNTGITISPAYWGPQQNNKGAVVRPPETKRLAIVDAAADFDAAVVQVYHWVYPLPLYRASDQPMLPDTRALELMMWIDLMGPDQKRHREAREYRVELYGRDLDGSTGALADLVNANPHFVQPVVPRTREGQIIKFGRHR
jgi:hypothetical protein